jgi:hypothetical protein
MKYVRDYFDRPNKAQAREWMFLDIPPRKSILAMPSQQTACVNQMVQQNIIGPKTRQQWVERNQRIAKLLEMRLHNHTHLHRGDLENYEPIYRIDLANLDMECSFTERLGLWIEHKLASKLLPNSYIILTVRAFGRNNEFMEQWLPEQIKAGLFHDELHQMKLLSGCLNDDILLPGVLLRSALHCFDARRIRSAGYRDREGTDMLCVCFHVTKRMKTNVTPFSQVVADYRKSPIIVDRRHTGNKSKKLFDTVVRTLSTLNFSISAADNGRWWLHNHDRAKTTLPMTFSLPEIMQFFQIVPDSNPAAIADDPEPTIATEPVVVAEPVLKLKPLSRTVMQEAGHKSWITRRQRAAAVAAQMTSN